MIKRFTAMLACILLCTTLTAHAAPRDAASVLNRCGKPLKGDQTTLDNSVSGGHRELMYERGTMHFSKVEMDGWTFTYGTHRKQDHLNAAEMARFMPCLTDALADSAAPAPLKPVTAVTRIETSVKRNYTNVILGGIAFIVLAGLTLLLYTRRRSVDEEV